jgi:hypothetical protein
MSLEQRVPSDISERREPSRCDVVLLRWPAQEDVRARLETDGLPRLLLISHSCPAPVCPDELEDWVREPLEPAELEARTVTLRYRARLATCRPRVDESGLVRAGDRWVDLPPAQLAVARVLIARLGRVVTAEQIQAAHLNAGGSTHPKAVKAMIGRVKRRLAELDLVLTNVRDRGYLLEAVRPERARHDDVIGSERRPSLVQINRQE